MVSFEDLEQESECFDETIAGESYMQRPSEFVWVYSFLERRPISMTMPNSFEDDLGGGVMKGLNTSMIPRTLENSLENFSFVTFEATAA